MRSVTTTLPLKLNDPPEAEGFVAKQRPAGRFVSESDLATAALRVVRELSAREDLKRSIDQADRGEVASLDTAATLRETRCRFLSEQ